MQEGQRNREKEIENRKWEIENRKSNHSTGHSDK
jgi:hypothetical protein